MSLLTPQSDEALLKYLTAHERKYVVANTKARQLSPGEVLIRQGDIDDTMYLVEDGILDVVDIEIDAQVPISSLRAGDVLGEIAFFTHSPRTATVRAQGDVTVRAFNRDNLRFIAQEAPEIFGKITLAICEILCYRMRNTLETLPQVIQGMQQLQHAAAGREMQISASTFTEMESALSAVEQHLRAST